MIDVFVDVLTKLASDGIYNKVIDPSIAFSTFYTILTDQQLVEQILSFYFHKDLKHPTKTPILCLCEELFDEKIATTLVKSWPIASSKVADLAERLHARICVSNTSVLTMNLQQETHMQNINEPPALGNLKKQLNELVHSCDIRKGNSQQVSPHELLPILRNMINTAALLSVEWKNLSTVMQHNIHNRDCAEKTIAEKDAEIKCLNKRINELETGVSDMCTKIELYTKQMETYSQEMAMKNEQILTLHQQLKDTSRDSNNREICALKELLNEKDSLISNVRTDLAESTATADRLAQECVYLNQRSEELLFYKSLIADTMNVLTTLSEKDVDLSYSPPVDNTYLKLPEYIAFIIDMIRTKARWLLTDESGRDLPLPSQDTSPLLQSEPMQSMLRFSKKEKSIDNSIPSISSNNHTDQANSHHLLRNPNTSILGRLAMVGIDAHNVISRPKEVQLY